MKLPGLRLAKTSLIGISGYFLYQSYYNVTAPKKYDFIANKE